MLVHAHVCVSSSSSFHEFIFIFTELATQIYAECEKLVPNQCVTLVGGIALVKQKRLLTTKRPSIIVATPGRLWAMVSLPHACVYP